MLVVLLVSCPLVSPIFQVPHNRCIEWSFYNWSKWLCAMNEISSITTICLQQLSNQLPPFSSHWQCLEWVIFKLSRFIPNKVLINKLFRNKKKTLTHFPNVVSYRLISFLHHYDLCEIWHVVKVYMLTCLVLHFWLGNLFIILPLLVLQLQWCECVRHNNLQELAQCESVCWEKRIAFIWER